MRLYLFTVPEHLANANGFEGELVRRFGGYTRLESKGALECNGKTWIESNAVYLIAVAGPGTASELRYWLMETLRLGGEKAVFLAEVGTAEIISLKE